MPASDPRSEFLGASAPTATKLTFDDIAISGTVGNMPRPYDGLSFSDDVHVMDTEAYFGGNRRSGFVRGTTSGHQVAEFNGSCSFSTINAVGTTTLHSMELTAGADTALVVDVYGAHDNVILYHERLTLTDRHPIRFAPQWTGIDYVYFQTVSETHDPHSPSNGPFVVLDDLVIGRIKPDPAAGLAHAFGPDHASAAPLLEHHVPMPALTGLV